VHAQAAAAGSFAKNDVGFIDPTGVDHDALGIALNKALYNYMHGIGLEQDVRGWFAGRVPKTTVPRHFIERAPFVLVAAACYARASERFYRWLLRNPTFGPLIIEWRRHRSIPYRVKWLAISLMSLTICASIWTFAGDALAAGNAGVHRHLHGALAVAHPVARPAAPTGVKFAQYKYITKGVCIMAKYSTESIRAVALVGHGGAGKTTLAEALLFKAGAIAAKGSVEKGSSVCDFDPQEKSAGHSLNSALVNFAAEGVHIHLIDTPGYPGFRRAGGRRPGRRRNRDRRHQRPDRHRTRHRAHDARGAGARPGAHDRDQQDRCRQPRPARTGGRHPRALRQGMPAARPARAWQPGRGRGAGARRRRRRLSIPSPTPIAS
jgi:hypothetical protein